MTHRLPPRPGELIDRSRPVTFTWNGTSHEGFEGDTIASALAASGVSVFSRSFKYHRRRGLLTASFLDPNLMVQVGDEPNVPAGHRSVTDAMEVTSQNTWPSLDFDARSANRAVGRFLSPGFYYKTFMAPSRLWPQYQRVLKQFSPGGEIGAEPSADRYDHRFAHPDVLIAGGGPSGMAAAIAAAQTGATVMLVEEEHQLGGHLRWGNRDDLTVLDELRSGVDTTEGIEVLTDSVVTGRYDHNWISVVQRSHPTVTERLIKARAKMLVVAPGLIERPYVFDGNDLPGVMLSTGVLRLMNLYAVKPGSHAVVLSANDSGDAAAAELRKAGAEVAMVDARSGESVARATGRGTVSGVELANGIKVDADLLVTATGWTTPTSLLNMAGSRPVYSGSAARYLPGPLPDDVLATGELIGDGSTEDLVEHGSSVGREAAERALGTRARWQAAMPTSDTTLPVTRPARPIDPLPTANHPELYRSSTHGFVDFSEDIKSKDLAGAVAEGYDSMELAKRYTTVTMGPLQGKLEVANAVAVHADATGRSIAETGTTTWRPPYTPTSLAVLAGPHYQPVRHSPIQAWHEANSAKPLVAGQWIRPEHYGNPRQEVVNVRENVGVIDVSPLGKIDLRGPDVRALLEFVYTNRWQKLAVGSVRYGVMCADDGVVFDDGVVGRLDDNRWLMTTTSGGAGRVWNWLDDWIQSKGWDVSKTAVTDGYVSINVAGPRSRDLMARLTDIELDPETFPYMRVRTGTVAGIADCIVWRIGFTGELSYEIHLPAGHGLHVWEALLEQGAELGVQPFGVEAQRIMRLEKGHFIVGQDTDGLTQGFAAGVDWAIKLDKSDFAGKPELVWQSEGADHMRLVPLQPTNPKLVPPEATQIVDGNAIIGRITSSRMSPTLKRSVCLGQVSGAYAAAGSTLTVRLPNGAEAPVRVMEHHAHFDPEGVRLHG